jgi:tripartite-type tricarboxylate transporter receptor subunit TctC
MLRLCKIALVFFALCTPFAKGNAQTDYPNKPIKIIVPVAAGGGTDAVTRLIAQKLNQAWGIPVIVDNHPGGAGNVGVELATRAPADGYTLVVPITSFSVNPSLYDKLPFDTQKDLAPVALLASAPLVLVTTNSLPVKNIQDLIALAKAKPGALNYGNSGIGTTAHLAAELFNHSAGLNIVNVPYKGGGPAIVDLVAGNIQIYFSTVPAAIAQTKADRVRALAVTSPARVAKLAEIPTIAESGLPGFEVVGWFGLFAPAKTPAPIVDKLNKEINRILLLPDVQERLAEEGLIPGGGSAKALGDFLAMEMTKWADLIKVVGIKAKE